LKGTPFSELAEETARLSAEGLQAEFCKILEYIPAENRLLMRAGIGWHAGLVGTASVGADLASPSGYALRTGRPVISNHLKGEERFRTPELLAIHGVRRAINVILQGDGAPYGVLEVDSRSEGEFTEEDIAFLQGSANLLGMALERQRRESVLKDAIARQGVLLKEINHRVKNSLQLVASMLSLQAGAAPGLRDQLQDASNRVMAIARAHDRLYRSPNVEKIELSDYLSDICRDLDEGIPNCEVRFANSGPLFLNTDRAISVALMVNELVANAAKHAYPDEAQGSIAVCLTRHNAHTASISVRDEGVGLPAEFDVQNQMGLGMRLVMALTKQTHAQLRIERHPRGSEFVLEIPVNPD
jgi:two-component sensor histidine kinase